MHMEESTEFTKTKLEYVPLWLLPEVDALPDLIQ